MIYEIVCIFFRLNCCQTSLYALNCSLAANVSRGSFRNFLISVESIITAQH